MGIKILITGKGPDKIQFHKFLGISCVNDDLKRIPAVGDAVNWVELASLFEDAPRPVVVSAITESADQMRRRIKEGKEIDFSKESFIDLVFARFEEISSPKLKKVVNATGIIVHTNLGRSVLAKEAISAVSRVATSYSTLEYDPQLRKRGSRHSLVSGLLCEITGAEGAMVVNNNAAAVLIALNTLAQEKEVIVSRGELVEIGGSFRVPDVMEKSGCALVEVGATNKTHLEDYRRGVTGNTALFLKVHTSNYRIVGFSTSVTGKELAAIGREFDIPVMEDLGSGFFYGPPIMVKADEPSVMEVVKNGLDVITFSGDKLLGGPQAGIILGKEKFIRKIGNNPLARAVRVDKMTLAALEATLRIYRDPKESLKKIPTLKMAGGDIKVLREKARRLAVMIRKDAGSRAKVAVITTVARMGGGSLPVMNLPSAAVSILPEKISVEKLDRLLHKEKIPVIGRIEDGKYLLDVRTLLDGESKIIQNALAGILKKDG